MIADWLVLFSAVVLVVSLFLPWSSLSSSYVSVADRLQTLQGVLTEPDAWQVYSAVDVLLALLAIAFVYVALAGPRAGRFVTLGAALIALMFTIHAVGTPPTNGAPETLHPIAGTPSSISPDPTPGAGETAAIIALVTAMGGLALSLVTD